MSVPSPIVSWPPAWSAAARVGPVKPGPPASGHAQIPRRLATPSVSSGSPSSRNGAGAWACREWRRATEDAAVPRRWRGLGVPSWLCWMQPVWFGWIVWSAVSAHDAAELSRDRIGEARASVLVILQPWGNSAAVSKNSGFGLDDAAATDAGAGRWARVRAWARRTWRRTYAWARRSWVWWFPGWARRVGAVDVVWGTSELVDDVVAPAATLRGTARRVVSADSARVAEAGLHTVVWNAVGLATAAADRPSRRRRLDGLILQLHEATENLERVRAHALATALLSPGSEPVTPSGRGMDPGADQGADPVAERGVDQDTDPGTVAGPAGTAGSASAQANADDDPFGTPDSFPQPRSDSPRRHRRRTNNDGGEDGNGLEAV